MRGVGIEIVVVFRFRIRRVRRGRRSSAETDLPSSSNRSNVGVEEDGEDVVGIVIKVGSILKITENNSILFFKNNNKTINFNK